MSVILNLSSLLWKKDLPTNKGKIGIETFKTNGHISVIAKTILSLATVGYVVPKAIALGSGGSLLLAGVVTIIGAVILMNIINYTMSVRVKYSTGAVEEGSFNKGALVRGTKFYPPKSLADQTMVPEDPKTWNVVVEKGYFLSKDGFSTLTEGTRFYPSGTDTLRGRVEMTGKFDKNGNMIDGIIIFENGNTWEGKFIYKKGYNNQMWPVLTGEGKKFLKADGLTLKGTFKDGTLINGTMTKNDGTVKNYKDGKEVKD